MSFSWAVPARVLRVVDADTFEVDADLGWHVHWKGKCRLVNADAPELSTPEGQAAKAWVTDLLDTYDLTGLTLISARLDQYGRVLGRLILPDGQDLGLVLIREGQAVPHTRNLEEDAS